MGVQSIVNMQKKIKYKKIGSLVRGLSLITKAKVGSVVSDNISTDYYRLTSHRLDYNQLTDQAHLVLLKLNS